MPTPDNVIDRLLKSDEPSVRWKVRVGVLCEDPKSRPVRRLQDEIRSSPRVLTLLKNRDSAGVLRSPSDVYAKWHGAHWVVASLANLGYPAGDESLRPLAEQVLDHWLRPEFFAEFDAERKSGVHGKVGVPRMQGRYRRCGSQQGNALLSLTRLGLIDAKCATALAERLLHWQWPDGGWNCDKDPSADTSSFMETLLPMRGLECHARAAGDAAARAAAKRAAEVFLSRGLFKRRSDAQVIRREFIKLHHPLYWHYDILGGLVAMAELGLIKDDRCNDALDLLERKRLPDGGWSAEARYYTVSSKPAHNADSVDWGGTGSRRMNEWVTADALTVLRAAGRLAL
jgi:hypothetical protein